MAELHPLPKTTVPPVSSIDPRRRYVGIADAGYATDLSKSFIHQQVQAGVLPAFRVGRRILIAVDDLDQFVRRVPA